MAKIRNPIIVGGVDLTATEALVDRLGIAVSTYPYSITNTLTNCTSDNNSTTAMINSSYTATITADSGYTLTGGTISVTMGGVDITSTAYDNGIITIASVTGDLVISISAVELVEHFITFSSPNSFTLEVVDNQKYWDGTIEYSTNKTTWNTWDGTIVLSSVNDGTTYNLYMRGTSNTYLTDYLASGTVERWKITGTNVSCKGNIENLLDYATVELGNHPPMAGMCFYNLFRGNNALISGPSLPSPVVTPSCYEKMFYLDENLETINDLPATTMAQTCYRDMYAYCTKINLWNDDTSPHSTPYRLPSNGTGTTAVYWNNSMFVGTQGNVVTPDIDTTYYTSNQIV